MSSPAAQPASSGAGRGRAGRNMTRSRAGILAGARSCLVRYGSRKTTMGDIAALGGVAKATLYNHFRTKSDVYAALLADEVDGLLAEVAALPAAPGSAESVRDALALAATRLSEHAVLRAFAAREPALAAAFTVPDRTGPWVAARRLLLQRVSLAQAAGALHARHDAVTATETLLRWVVSHVLWPEPASACEVAAGQLVQGLAASPYAAAGATVGLTAAPAPAEQWLSGSSAPVGA